MTNGSGFIKNLSLSEIKRLRIQSDKTASTHKIPTLAEVLDLVDGRIILNIEIKVNGLPPKHGIEEKVVDILKQFKVKHSAIISSFHPLTVRRIKRIDDEVINGILIEKNFTIRNYEIFFLKMAGAKAIHMEGGLANSSLIDQVNKHGFYSLVWTVNEPALMRNLIEWGASGIITDRPDMLQEIIERHYENE